MRTFVIAAILAALAAARGAAEPQPPSSRPQPIQPSCLERSYWIHASLAWNPRRGYWGADLPGSTPPGEQEVRRAAGLLAGHYAANRLYLVYHKEIPLPEAREVFRWWRRHTPPGVAIVPALVLRTYDKASVEVFTGDEVRPLCDFFRAEINPHQLAVFDVYPNRDQGAALAVLAAAFPSGLIRLGLQPGEKLAPPFAAAVEDTWSAICHGRSHDDWFDAGFGAETLRRWVAERNAGPAPVAWNLIAVAWDYRHTHRGEHPGYDAPARNMPLPAGRNLLALREILRHARPEVLAGFSSDLTILQANSAHPTHDARPRCLHDSLKKGEAYAGYYAEPLEEIAAIYRALRDDRLPAPWTTRGGAGRSPGPAEAADPLAPRMPDCRQRPP